MSLDLKSVAFDQYAHCAVCLEPAKDALSHPGGEAHRFCKECIRPEAGNHPEKFSCPCCRAALNPRSVLSEVEYIGSMVLSELSKRQERQDTALEDQRLAGRLQREEFRRGQNRPNADQVANDAAIAQVLQNQAPNGQRCNSCIATTFGAFATAAVVFIATRYFF